MDALSTALTHAALYCVLLFICIFVVQIFVWKIFRIKKQMLALFVLYLFFPIVGFLYIFITQGITLISLASMALFLPIAFAYIMSFPAIQARSPSLLILLELEKKPGLRKEELLQCMKEEFSLQYRMENLAADGLATFSSSEKIQPQFFGRILAKFFLYYRRVMKLEGRNG